MGENIKHIDHVTIREGMEKNMPYRAEIRSELLRLDQAAALAKKKYREARAKHHFDWIESKRPQTNADKCIAGLISGEEYDMELAEIMARHAKETLTDARQDGNMLQSLNKYYES